MKRMIALVLITFLLISIGFADVKPILPTPTTTPTATPTVTPTSAPLVLTFQEAYQLALKNSVDVKIANLTIQAETMAVDEATDAQRNAQKMEDAFTSLEAKYVLNGLVLRSAEMGLNIANRTKILTERGLELSVYNAYYGVALAQEKQEISKKNVSRLKELSDTVSLKFKLGLATKNDTEAATVNYTAAQNDLKNAELDLSTAKLTLNQALTIPLDSKLVLKDMLKSENLTMKPLVDALALVELNRFDVFVKAEAKAVANKSFTITENYYVNKGVSEYKKTEINKLKSDNAYNQAVVSANIDLTAAYNNMLKIRNSYQSVLSNLTVMQNTYNTTKKMYDLGMVPASTVAEVANGLSNLEYQSKSLLLQKNIVEKSYIMGYEVGGR